MLLLPVHVLGIALGTEPLLAVGAFFRFFELHAAVLTEFQADTSLVVCILEDLRLDQQAKISILNLPESLPWRVYDRNWAVCIKN